MKISKKILAIGITATIAATTTVAVFAANNSSNNINQNQNNLTNSTPSNSLEEMLKDTVVSNENATFRYVTVCFDTNGDSEIELIGNVQSKILVNSYFCACITPKVVKAGYEFECWCYKNDQGELIEITPTTIIGTSTPTITDQGVLTVYPRLISTLPETFPTIEGESVQYLSLNKNYDKSGDGTTYTAGSGILDYCIMYNGQKLKSADVDENVEEGYVNGIKWTWTKDDAYTTHEIDAEISSNKIVTGQDVCYSTLNSWFDDQQQACQIVINAEFSVNGRPYNIHKTITLALPYDVSYVQDSKGLWSLSNKTVGNAPIWMVCENFDGTHTDQMSYGLVDYSSLCGSGDIAVSSLAYSSSTPKEFTRATGPNVFSPEDLWFGRSFIGSDGKIDDGFLAGCKGLQNCTINANYARINKIGDDFCADSNLANLTSTFWGTLATTAEDNGCIQSLISVGNNFLANSEVKNINGTALPIIGKIGKNFCERCFLADHNAKIDLNGTIVIDDCFCINSGVAEVSCGDSLYQIGNQFLYVCNYLTKLTVNCDVFSFAGATGSSNYGYVTKDMAEGSWATGAVTIEGSYATQFKTKFAEMTPTDTEAGTKYGRLWA